MNYKSPYRVVLRLKEKELNEKRKEMTELAGQKNEILGKIEKEKQKMLIFHKEAEVLNSAYFSNGYDHEYVQGLTIQLKDKEEELKEKLVEYNIIKKKKEAVIEMDREKEKEFNKMIRKKEQRKISSLHVISKILKKRRG